MDTVFTRAAYYLDDYVELYESCILGAWGGEAHPEEKKQQQAHDEMQKLSKALKNLSGEWEQKRKFGNPKTAADIIADMLREWKVPGAVWYLPKAQRFRVVGEGYMPIKDEVCIGVYLSSATSAMIEQDIKDVLQPEYVEER